MRYVAIELLVFLRRDAIRAISILALLMAALLSQSVIVWAILVLVILGLCFDTLQISRTTRTLRAIAEGDRFVAFPSSPINNLHCLDIAAAGERMRRDLIEADAAIADQRRMLAEARIRRDGASFFTARFHESVALAFSNFSQRGDEICATVDSLNQYNSGLLRDAHMMSDAVNGTASDIEAVSQAASRIADVVATTSDQIAASEVATRTTMTDLRRTRDTIQRLKKASHEVSTIIATIRSVATQTSLLALNATIEAARAGEKGLGFAVVASEVKTLATRSEQATGTIRRQIEEIQSAVDETAGAIDAIMGRVQSLTATHDAFAVSLAESTAAIESVGAKADVVAGRVSGTMPDLASGVGEIEMAGRSVLDNARKLMSGSERLVENFQTYFADLASGAIKVGVLHSLSGTVTATERAPHDLLIGLIEETNRNGGLLGRPLEAVIVNPRADAAAYAEGARTLLGAGAAAIFGCWTSQSRIETIPVLEAADGLLFYPSQYEGGELSPAVFYGGGTPPQQAWPAVDFLADRGRRRLVLIGDGSVYAAGTHASIKRYAPSAGATVVLELTVPPTGANWTTVVADLLKAEKRAPLAIMSTLPGAPSVSLFREMARHKIAAERMPTLSLSIGETQMAALDARSMAGHYVAWNYLHGVDGAANEAFVAMWRRLCGDPAAFTDDSLEATFINFSFWTMAVRKANSTRTADVRAALQGLSLLAPSGSLISVTPDQHTTLPAFVGQIRADGSIFPVWASRMIRDANGRHRPAVALAA